MCGRYSITQDLLALQERFGFEPGGPALAPRYNAAPGQDLPVVVEREGRRLNLMRWGLVPHWAKDERIGYRTINARAETAAQKPAFGEPLRRRRCLVLADGFYEWLKRSGRRAGLPFRITLQDGRPFALAGLWDAWRAPGGERLESFTILTTAANALISRLHERMPVILRPEDEAAWLDPDVQSPERLAGLLQAYPPELMLIYRVSPLVNSTASQGPDCIAPLEAPSA